MAVSLKVPVALLIDNAEKQRITVLAQHSLAKEKAKRTEETYRQKVVDALYDAAYRVEGGGKLPKHSYIYGQGPKRSGIELVVKHERPEKPSKPNTSRIDRDLKVLRATSQTDVTVRAGSDLERYL